MPEHLRALVVILVFSLVVFGMAKAPITAQACTLEDFKRRRNMWFVLTLAAFLAHNYWLFTAIFIFAVVYAMRTESNAFALYLGLMLCLPRLAQSISGMGLMNELFVVEPLRLLSLFVLLPAWLKLRRRPDVEPFGSLLSDKFLIGYLALEVALTLPFRTFTSVLRDSVFYAFTNTFLIYYVASRSLRSQKAFRDALGAFIVGAMAFSLIVAFEFYRHWLLYSAVGRPLGVDLGGSYLLRSGRLRAVGSAQQSIVAGYTCAIAIGLYMYVRTQIPNVLMRRLGLLLLFAGIIGAFARAPWLGAAGTIMLFMLLGPNALGSVTKMLLALVVAIPFLLSTDSGSVILDHLPWIGTVDARNVDGREHLAEVALKVIMMNPWFGDFDYASTPAIEDLRGSDGIIDLVNTYVMIALKGGFVSLALFAGVVAVALINLFFSLLRLNKSDERHVLGRALLATLIGTLFVMGTVSPIFFVFPLYWCLTGLAVGFSCMVERQAAAAAQRSRAPMPMPVQRQQPQVPPRRPQTATSAAASAAQMRRGRGTEPR